MAARIISLVTVITIIDIQSNVAIETRKNRQVFGVELDRIDNREGLLSIPEPLRYHLRLIPLNSKQKEASHAILHKSAQTLRWNRPAH